MRRCRFPFGGDLNSTSGPDVLLAALSEALHGDPRFEPLACGPQPADTVAWYPTYHWANEIRAAMTRGERFAVGPNVIFSDSQQPGVGGFETALLQYPNLAASLCLSRWYAALQEKHFKAKTPVFILDYPLPQAWIWRDAFTYTGEHLFAFIKGGAAEFAVFAALQKHFPTMTAIHYGRYAREQLFTASQSSAACFYISREDHYPLAAVEIGLMGCPIISDEKICSVVQHGVTGIIAAVRERGESDGFRWTADAAERMAVEWKAAAQMDRGAVREATIRKHSAALMRERVAAQLGLG